MKKTFLLQHPLTLTDFIKNRKKLWLFVLVLGIISISNAANRSCVSYDLLKNKLKSDPAFAKSREQLEKLTDVFVENYYKNEKTNNSATHRTGLITIPVVFHIIHNGEATGTGANISNAQITSQIQVLNEDFRRLNNDKNLTPLAFRNVAADCEIEFCIALQDPQGNPALAINRINGGRASWDLNSMEALKPTLVWDPTRYLNIYVADITQTGFIGFATFPVLPIPMNDGIVCDFRTVGRAPANPFNAFFGGVFNKGRTATHEIGHWLDVFHVWGDDGNACNGTDLVNDTPNQGGPNFGCPMFPRISCNNFPNGDMFMNYMDLSDDGCMNMFSTGQKVRMSATLDNIRTGFVNSTLCNRVFTATNITANTATLTWSPFIDAVSYNIRWQPVGLNGAWVNAASVNNTINIAGLAPFPAAYAWEVQPVFATGPGVFSVTQLFRTMPAIPAIACPNDPNENAIFGPYLASGVTGTGIICPGADIDRFVIMNNMGQASTLRLILSNLLLDYDIELRDANNNLMANSTKTGTGNDTIKYANFQQGNYYVYVFAKAPGIVNLQPYMVNMVQIPNGAPLPPGFRAPVAPEKEIEIFPNPATHNVSVSLGGYSGNATISLLDITGREMKSIRKNINLGEQENISLENIPSGLYFVDIIMNEKRISKKLIIQ